jgi:hypothetical protein
LQHPSNKAVISQPKALQQLTDSKTFVYFIFKSIAPFFAFIKFFSLIVVLNSLFSQPALKPSFQQIFFST